MLYSYFSYIYNERTKKTRLVFDSSATFQGKNLNNALLQGPDQGNKLVSVLMRFRLGEIGFSCDIEKMFYSFYVPESDRDLLRFFWFSRNDPENEVVEFRANVHVFGNRSSPAIANFGLKYATKNLDDPKLCMAAEFINKNFYVDDGLGSADSDADVVSLLEGSIQILSKFGIKLHKICSPSRTVSAVFPDNVLSKHTKSCKIISDNTDCRTLGVIWRLDDDSFSLSSTIPDRPFTKRSVLAVIHSIYDPLGLACPIVLEGKLLQRLVFQRKDKTTPEIEQCGWDDPLPVQYKEDWYKWVGSLRDIETLSIPRGRKPPGFGLVIKSELHCFSDASKDSIGKVIYLRSFNEAGDVSVAFICASSKVSPRAADTIPRLELSAAMDMVWTSKKVINELSLESNDIFYYTDSLVVLGYLGNHNKRFSRYVARRVEEILRFSTIAQWNHIAGTDNVGDIATRPHTVDLLRKTKWFAGPDFLQQGKYHSPAQPNIEVSLPEQCQVKTLSIKCSISSAYVFEHICNRTNCWQKAINILTNVLKFIRMSVFFYFNHLRVTFKRKKILKK